MPVNKRQTSVTMFGVTISNISLDKLLQEIVQTILNKDKKIMANVNIHAMNLAYTYPSFRKFLQQADLVYCDGVGVRWGAFLMGERIGYRFTPPDWMPVLAEQCSQQQFSIFFLGARAGVAEKAAVRLRKLFPQLRVVGTHHGYFNKMPGHPENEAVIQIINEAHPDILVLGFGMPMQENWLQNNWNAIESCVAIPAGAVFDYLAGEIYRLPRWLTNNGMEWLGRLIVEPRRLWKRYLIGNPLFVYRILRQRLGLLSFDD